MPLFYIWTISCKMAPSVRFPTVAINCWRPSTMQRTCQPALPFRETPRKPLSLTVPRECCLGHQLTASESSFTWFSSRVKIYWMRFWRLWSKSFSSCGRIISRLNICLIIFWVFFRYAGEKLPSTLRYNCMICVRLSISNDLIRSPRRSRYVIIICTFFSLVRFTLPGCFE